MCPLPFTFSYYTPLSFFNFSLSLSPSHIALGVSAVYPVRTCPLPFLHGSAISSTSPSCTSLLYRPFSLFPFCFLFSCFFLFYRILLYRLPCFISYNITGIWRIFNSLDRFLSSKRSPSKLCMILFLSSPPVLSFSSLLPPDSSCSCSCFFLLLVLVPSSSSSSSFSS